MIVEHIAQSKGGHQVYKWERREDVQKRRNLKRTWIHGGAEKAVSRQKVLIE